MAAHNTELAHKGTKIGEPLMHGNYDHDVDALFSDAMSVGKIVGVLDLKTRHQQTQRRPWTGWSHNRAWWFSNMTPCMMGATSMPSSPSWTRRLCRNRRHTAPANDALLTWRKCACVPDWPRRQQFRWWNMRKGTCAASWVTPPMSWLPSRRCYVISSPLSTTRYLLDNALLQHAGTAVVDLDPLNGEVWCLYYL
jgi:hypothetical protein